MSKIIDLVEAGYTEAQAETIQAAIDGGATAADLVAQGFTITQAITIMATPRVAADMVSQGLWASTAETIAKSDGFKLDTDFTYARCFSDHVRFDGEPYSQAFQEALWAIGTFSYMRLKFKAHPGNSLFPSESYEAVVHIEGAETPSETRTNVYFSWVSGDDLSSPQPSVSEMTVEFLAQAP